MEITNITLKDFDRLTLQERAAAIRDAVANKAVTPHMVGALFADLIDTCGDIRTALQIIKRICLYPIIGKCCYSHYLPLLIPIYPTIGLAKQFFLI